MTSKSHTPPMLRISLVGNIWHYKLHIDGCGYTIAKSREILSAAEVNNILEPYYTYHYWVRYSHTYFQLLESVISSLTPR
jgi:hypothetical protein